MPQEDRLTLKKMTFSKSLRGYSCDEVDTYMEYVTDKYAQVCREYTEVRRRLATAAARESELRAEDEQALKNRMEKCQQSCDAMVDEAKRQAARILADAEHEAKLIIRHAEDEAQHIAANAAREGTKAQHEANRSIAAKSNLADRLVQEIDSFRKEVFAMYASHIDALEHLGKMTDDFYQQKNELADAGEAYSAAMPIPDEGETEEEPCLPEEPADETCAEAESEAEETAEEALTEEEFVIEEPIPEEPAEEPMEEPIPEESAEEPAPEELFMEPEAEEAVWETLAEEPEADEPIPVKMDWESVLDNEELPEIKPDLEEAILFAGYAEAEDGIPADADDPDEGEEEYEVWSGQEYDGEETAEDAGESFDEPEEFWEDEAEFAEEELFDILPETEQWEDTEEEPAEAMDAGENEIDPMTDPDEEFTDTTELLRTLFGDADWEGTGETEDTYDEEELPADETDEAYGQDFGEDENDMLLAGLKSIYGTPEEDADEEADEDDFAEETAVSSFVPAKRKAVRDPKDLDDLFQSGDATNSTKDISLTGEFDIIYSNDKSLKNVEEIGKQPLIAPEAPKKPKKHSKF